MGADDGLSATGELLIERAVGQQRQQLLLGERLKSPEGAPVLRTTDAANAHRLELAAALDQLRWRHPQFQHRVPNAAAEVSVADRLEAHRRLSRCLSVVFRLLSHRSGLFYPNLPIPPILNRPG